MIQHYRKLKLGKDVYNVDICYAYFIKSSAAVYIILTNDIFLLPLSIIISPLPWHPFISSHDSLLITGWIRPILGFKILHGQGVYRSSEYGACVGSPSDYQVLYHLISTEGNKNCKTCRSISGTIKCCVLFSVETALHNRLDERSPLLLLHRHSYYPLSV